MMEGKDRMHEKCECGMKHSIEELCPDHKFCCPRVVPADVEDDRFCMPGCCPEKIPTKRFPSPNSPLPPHELEMLKAHIEKINQLLLAFGVIRNENNLAGLRAHFRGLRGRFAEAEFECGEEKESVKGAIKDAGRDYLEIQDIDKAYFIPFLRLAAVNRPDCEGHDMAMGHELEDIDPCLRRRLVLNFGETVAADPKLISIFFGLPLYAKLVCFIGCRIKVKFDNSQEEEIEGTLVESEIEHIRIKKEEEIRQINIDQICMVTV